MARVRLGRLCGLEASRVGIGFWQAGGRLWGRYSPEDAYAVVSEALSRGINLFDTAEIYGNGRSERLLGEALRRSGGGGEAVVVTKVAGYRVTWSGFRKAVEASARRLGRKPDLVLYHWPPPYPFTPCRVARLLERLVEEGLTACIGVSNFNARELEEAAGCTKRHEIAVNQIHYSLAHRSPENKLLPAMRRLGATPMAWGPLAKGALAGKTRPNNPARLLDPVFHRAARDRRLQKALERAAERLSATKAVAALAWLVSRGAVPIVGARRRRHVADAALAASLRLPPDVERLLDEASRRYRGRGGYSELHFNRLIPPPLQWLLYRVAMQGV